MFGMEPMTLVATVATFIAGVAVVTFLFRKDDSIEARRRDALEIATDFGKVGLDVFQPLLNAYAVGDYSGLYTELKQIARTLRDDKTRAAALRRFFDAQLADRLADPKERQEIENLLGEAKQRIVQQAQS